MNTKNLQLNLDNHGTIETGSTDATCSFEDLKNTIQTSHGLHELNESLEQEKLSIEYTVKKGAKVYIDAMGTKVLCQCPGEIFLQTNAIDSDNSNQDYLCITYGDQKVRINKQDLPSCKGKSLDEIYPPTSETVIRVDKAKRMMTVYDQYGQKVKECSIALSPGEHGDKRMRGDNCTPEGKYTFCNKGSSNYGTDPKTKKPLQNLQVNYPNSQDAFEGLISGTISKTEFDNINTAIKQGKKTPQETALGGEIMFHGGGNWKDRGNKDWTAGCIALNDNDMAWLLSYLGENINIDIYIE